MDKKIIRNLIILLVVIALLATVYVLIGKKQEVPEEVQNIEIFTCSKTDIKEIHVENAKESFTLLQNDENEVWQIKEYPEVPVYQTKVSNLLYTLSSVYATAVVEENATSLDMYGLQKPKGIAIIRLKDGSTQRFFLGNDLAVGTDAYFMKEGDPTVYAVTNLSWNAIILEASNFFDMELPEVLNETVTSIDIQHQGGAHWSFEKSGDAQDGYAADWKMTAPFVRVADNSTVENNLLGKLKNMNAINVFAPTEEKPLLDAASARAVIRVSTLEGNTTYFVGERTDAGTYFSIEGQSLLYLVSSASFDFLNDDPYRYIDKTIKSVPMQEVKEVEVTLSGTTYTLKVGETFTLNDTEIEEETARSLYAEMIGLTTSGVLQGESKTPDGQNQIRYIKQDGSVETVEFAAAGERAFAVTVEGETLFTCAASSLDALSEKLEEAK